MILKGLNWGLSPMTPNAWMRLYMQICHGSKMPCDEAFFLPAYSGLPFSRAMQLLDLCLLDMSSLEFSYSVLAASALRERSPLQPKSFHGISPEDAHHLQPHVVDLELLARAQDRLAAIATGGLRESPDPSTNLPIGLSDTPQEQ